MYALAIYNAFTGDFTLFLNKLESLMNYLYKPKAKFVICSDINIVYLDERYHKCSTPTYFNLMSTVNIPTKIQTYSSTATDIFQ
jgi:hypothetical protein